MSMNPYKGKKVLLIEDEESLAMGLEYNLSEEGYRVRWAKDGLSGFEQFNNDKPDLIILDIMLPYMDGFELAEKIRQSDPRLPILMLTARTSPDDRIRGLEIGADDYLTKPFHLEELLLRVKGMLKRKDWYKTSVGDKPVFHLGKTEIDFEQMTCIKDKKPFQLTLHESMVLKYFFENPDKIISRQELLEKVWNISSDVETRTVDNFIVKLRKYIEPDPANPTYIKSVRGVGYKFTV
jgi:two-component system alkaline phosphatase synthesis response regulator PhoP